jgi:methylenetetrahydrofolate dehydrogenase (NADP+) / methenyltetrahydrofolate cyclohydrolase
VSARIINGKDFAESLSKRMVPAISAFQSETGRVPGLAVVLVGDDPASEIYIRNEGRKALELGMGSFQHILPASTTQNDLLDLVAELNANDAVDGILVQLPLPGQIDELAVISAVDPGKDVDGLHVVSAGRLVAGLPGMTSCTPLGCLMLLKDQIGDLSGLDRHRHRTLHSGRQADGSIAAGRELHRYHRPLPNAGSG